MSGFLDTWISLTGQYFIYFLRTNIAKIRNIQKMAFSNFLLHLMRSFDWKQKNLVSYFCYPRVFSILAPENIIATKKNAISEYK